MPHDNEQAPMQTLPRLSLIIGGTASGKSRIAEVLATASGLGRIYIATAEARDAEMQTKIARHRQDRGPDWQTIEAPLDLCGALRDARPGSVVLVDCLTLWLSNHLLADHDPEAETTALITCLDDHAGPVVLVSNEVGNSIVPDNALARSFQAAQGRLNQRIAAHADLVATVIAGLPLALKGTLPRGLA